jgi:methionine sulfoxide reductase heme-binding subunit
MLAAVTSGPSAYWYLTRATGIVSLVLITLSVVLGVVNVRRVRTPSVPRFVFDAVHRNASLLAMVFLLVHIITSVLDKFAPIRIVDAVVPFVSVYRPLWLGLGALSFDLLVAVTVTSLVRRRLGYQAWRAIHWLAYASWPVALLHTYGTGSDAKSGWLLAITGLCVAAVSVAAVSRSTAGWPDHQGARLTGLASAALLPLALIVWLPTGPLAKGWAKRAGTPASLLGAAPTSSVAVVSKKTTSTRKRVTSPTRSASGAGTVPKSAFTASLSGTSSQGQTQDGLAVVNLTLTVNGQALSNLDFQIIGQPAEGGGVAMTSSRVTLGTASNPHMYTGVITALQGTALGASVRDSAGHRLRIAAQLQLSSSSNTVSGATTITPGGGR